MSTIASPTRICARPNHIMLLVALLGASILGTGCSTAPKAEKRGEFLDHAAEATQWFEANVTGLEDQIDHAAAYIVYPAVGQWGILFSGGQFGRGLLSRPDGTQIGWGAINTASVGLQIGGRGFKMLVVFQNQQTLDTFMENKLTGSVTSVAVAGDGGASATSPFTHGVVVYKGDSSGLMAGVNIGLDYMRYKPLEDEPQQPTP